ncbi:hypothetical protein ACTXG7_00865 [Mycolicibacterium sp. Dal123E01]|uniref:hypothetical protein n=1 Tax=Mycolicibacterium sp. Dal123E01 TaxID=3457578 RepID=UPI00403EF07F
MPDSAVDLHGPPQFLTCHDRVVVLQSTTRRSWNCASSSTRRAPAPDRGPVPFGELQFDAFNRLRIRTHWVDRVVRRSGSTLQWGIGGPAAIVRTVPGLRLLACMSRFEAERFRGVSREYRIMARAMSVVPALRKKAQHHRHTF